MSILLNHETKVLVQGITGRAGRVQTKWMLDYGTNIVAGVTPGKGGQKFNDTVPVYDTVNEAVTETGANTSVIFVPPFGAAGAIYEAADAGCKLIVCITEGVPTVDMVKVMPFLQERGVLEGLVLKISNGIKFVLYSTLFLAAVYWGFKGNFVDFWDAFLWLVAFFFIEMNVVEWRQEMLDEGAAHPA